MAIISVGDSTVKLGAGCFGVRSSAQNEEDIAVVVSPKYTASTFINSPPVIVTEVPPEVGPLIGAILVVNGGAWYV